MEVKIVSIDHIKPSSPTPSHLRTFKLSLLDQLIPSPYAPIILFYPPNDDVSNSNKLESLKKSLSETLTDLYPLAGKIKDDLSIDCDDGGAYFAEAKVDSSLRDFLNQPDYLLLLQKLLPCDLNFAASNRNDNNHVANIQINVFGCGGLAVGLCISHKILDGAALSSFLRSWATTARGDRTCKAARPPSFEAANSLFPANDAGDLWLRDTSMVMFGSFFTKGKCVTKRFVFDASAILSLRSEASRSSSSAAVQNPTRVEAVSAFIWRCVISAAKDRNGGVSRPSLSTHLVNLRRRTTPFLSEHCLGNLLWIASAQSRPARGDHAVAGVSELVGLLRESFSKTDGDFVKRLRGEKRRFRMLESLNRIIQVMGDGEMDQIGFSSWCKFGFYEADFGWGRPAWVSSFGLSGSVFMKLVILADTRLGDGIEAWVTLDERDMAIMESNTELLQLAQVDPTPF
ncbi:Salutaridinol 7-O-acetyltransferase [Morus notabilis]|uniref:Salutaridinol 7-O-acetyltransferase n=1 Tax=Morus notabilis TaxID=981085 RepID=W9QWJ9_9ROSA|nr:vinorine synthase [Morus notabilis]EXB56328.1 Salutaridinol 7-O-acetyltransferase [Morus notabilis]